MRRWIRFSSLVLGVMLVSSSCKTTTDSSEEKSLDNMARGAQGAFVQNQCGMGTPEVEAADGQLLDEIVANPAMVAVEGGANTAAATKAVRQSLQSIPGVLLGGFFMLGGTIAVTADAPRLCATAREQFKDPSQHVFQTEGGREVTSCWRKTVSNVEAEGGGFDLVENFVVYVSSDPAKISHGLVRAIGHVLAEHFFKAQLDASANQVNMNGTDDAFLAAKEAVARAVLLDTLPGAKGGADLSLFKPLLGAVLDAGDEASRIAAWEKFSTSNADGAELFRTYATVEAFDSWYCSDKSRATMQGDFPRSYAAFTEIATAISDMVKELPEVDNREALAASASSAGGSGTNLTGGSSPESESFTPAVLAGAPKSSSKVTPKAKNTKLFRGRLLGGAARAVGAVARGVGRVGVGVVRGTGRVAAGVVRGTGRVAAGVVRGAGRVVAAAGRVAVGVVRATGYVVRGAARVAVGVVRGTARVIGVVARGGARIIRGAAVGVVRATGWVIRGTGEVVRGLFGPFRWLAGCVGLRCGGYYGLNNSSVTSDMDGDGVTDGGDQCSNTAKGAAVHKTGVFGGCAGGQYKDQDMAQMLLDSGYEANGDYDKDGVPNDVDECSNTPTGSAIHKVGEWAGCTIGQNRDSDVLDNLASVGAGS